MGDEYSTSLDDLATNLRMIRKMRGKSRRELANATGISITELAAIECGSIHVTVRTLQVIGNALGVQPNVLLADPVYVTRFVAWAKKKESHGRSGSHS